MPPEKHAALSASSSDRWIHCPPSVRLSKGFEDKESEYALEGTCAHALAEYKLRKALGLPAEDPTESLDYFSGEMDEATDGYAAYVIELAEEAKKTCSDPAVLTEQRVDFSRWVREGFGTADALIIADGTLRVIDLKYGTGVRVSAENNSQLKCYALGALEMFGDIYDITDISLTIYQPRLGNISEWKISKKDLLKWADDVLKPSADKAWDGEGDFSCGDWCRFCRAKQVCRARAEYNLELAKYDFEMPPELTDEETEAVLAKIDGLISWANDVKEYALSQALEGKKWTGFKLVEGRSVRRYTDEKAVAEVVSQAGYEPYEKKLLGITAMEKQLGRKQFNELLSAYVIKPQGKPTLAPESDKRPAINTAKQDFEN